MEVHHLLFILTMCFVGEVLGVVNRSGVSEARNVSSVNVSVNTSNANSTLDYYSSEEDYDVMNLTDAVEDSPTVQVQQSEYEYVDLINETETKSNLIDEQQRGVIEEREHLAHVEVANSTLKEVVIHESAAVYNDSSNLDQNVTADDNNQDEYYDTEYEEATNTNRTGNTTSLKDDNKTSATAIEDVRMGQPDFESQENESKAVNEIGDLEEDDYNSSEVEYGDFLNVTETLENGTAENDSVQDQFENEYGDFDNETLPVNTTDSIPTYVEDGVLEEHEDLELDFANSTDSDEYEENQVPSTSYSISSWLLDLLLGTNSSGTLDTVGGATDLDMSFNETIKVEHSPQEYPENNASTSDSHAPINEANYS